MVVASWSSQPRPSCLQHHVLLPADQVPERSPAWQLYSPSSGFGASASSSPPAGADVVAAGVVLGGSCVVRSQPTFWCEQHQAVCSSLQWTPTSPPIHCVIWLPSLQSYSAW